MRGKARKIIFSILIIFFIVSFSTVSALYSQNLKIDKEINSYKNYKSKINNNKNWTFIAYLNGDMRDLESSMLFYLNDMEHVGSNTDVDIVVQADDYRIWNNQTRRYYIIKDNNPNVINSPLADNNTNEKCMGEPQTLVDFVCWAADNYPAENYCLTIFNHGDGWRGICADDTPSGYHLDMDELKNAIENISVYLGKKLDILILDACEMGMIEVFYPIKDYVNFVVSSEDRITYLDISYKRILENLTKQPKIEPLDFTQKIVDASYNTYTGKPVHVYFGMDMDKIEDITMVIDDFSKVLINYTLSCDIIKKAYQYSLCWIGPQGGAYPHDIRRFAEKISELVYNSYIYNSANELINTIDTSIIRPTEENGHYVSPRLNGISIYFPQRKSDFEEKYKQQEFANFTQWDEFLYSFYNMIVKNNQKANIRSIFAKLISSDFIKFIQRFLIILFR